MTENEPIARIEFVKPLLEDSFKNLLKHISAYPFCKIYYEFRDEGILSLAKSNILERECEGDISFEEKKITLNYKSRKDDLNLYHRLKLYAPHESGNHSNLELALEMVEEIKRRVNNFFVEYHKL